MESTRVICHFLYSFWNNTTSVTPEAPTGWFRAIPLLDSKQFHSCPNCINNTTVCTADDVAGDINSLPGLLLAKPSLFMFCFLLVFPRSRSVGMNFINYAVFNGCRKVSLWYILSGRKLVSMFNNLSHKSEKKQKNGLLLNTITATNISDKQHVMNSSKC